MRTIGRLLVAVIAVLALPRIAAAQEGRLFKNAWFWGGKFGSYYFNSPNWEGGFAANVGGEWLITRTRAALYVSAGNVFMWEGPGSTSVADPYRSGGMARVEVGNIRHVTLALLAFPRVMGGNMRPYGGVGFTVMNTTATPELLGTESQAELEYLEQEIENANDYLGISPIAGLQIQYRRFSVFGQVIMMPRLATSSWMFNTNHNYLLEAGIRWNMGTSIEREF